MALIFAGYFPKKIEPAVDAMGLPGVSEIWSVSNCISKGPEGWIQRWLHNDYGAYDTEELAASVIPEDARAAFVILAYQLWQEEFDEVGTRPIGIAQHLSPVQIGPRYRSIGFDVVSASCGQFECSPLSCNGGAKQYGVNPRCLFRTLEEALSAARTFARGGWEPGPYRVVEVLAPGGST